MAFGLESTELIDIGQGPSTVVLLHGWCCRTGHFAEVAGQLARTHRVLVVDWFERMKIHGNHDYDGVSRDIVALMAERDVVDPLLCGHSMGGQLAVHMTEHEMIAARGVIALDATLVVSDALRKVLKTWVRNLEPETVSGFFPDALRSIYFKTDEHGPICDEIIQGMISQPLGAARDLLEAMMRVDLCATIERMHCPLHYVASAVNRSASLEEISGMLEQATFERLDCGHFMSIFRPDAIVRMIDDAAQPTPKSP